MDFSVLPPEINSARMHLGAGSGPMLAAAAAWDGLATELGGGCGLVFVGDLRAGGFILAGPGVGGDGVRGRTLCGVVERVANSRSNSSGGFNAGTG